MKALYLTIFLLLVLSFSCNTHQGFLDKELKAINGTYIIKSVNYVSTNGTDSVVYDLGEAFFPNCDYNDSSCDFEGFFYYNDLGYSNFRFDITSKNRMNLWADEQNVFNIIDFTIEYSLTGNELSLNFFDRENITVGTAYEPVAYKALLEKK